MVKTIDVFLLAAGESSRMFPLSTIMEKSLLPVDGKPVIRHIVENLTVPEVAKHIRNITICCLTKFKKQFEHEFRDMPSIEFKEFPEPKGTATTLYEALSDDELPNWIMVHYADCLTDIDYNDFISHMDEPRYEGLIAVTNTVKHDYSEVRVNDASHTVERFYEKPNIPGYTWSGIALFLKDYFVTYENIRNKSDIAKDVFPNMVWRGVLKAYPYNGYWYDVGNLNSYRKVCAMYDGENNK